MLGFAALLAAYGISGVIGGSIPTNSNWQAPPSGVRIWVESNGIHTGIVVPKVAAGIDWRPLLRADHLRDPRYAGYDHASFGWGDAKFYLETPTWGDVRLGTVIAAAFGSDDTLVHVDHVPAPAHGSGARSIMLSLAQYRRLSEFIRATIANPQVHQFGYGRYDVFYAGRGRYSAVATCNAWTGDALRHAGVRVGAWTPFPVTVMRWF